jgi:putative ABC transport system permease protein
MRIHFVEGGEFRPEDTSPGVAIVNETFVKQFFPGEYPLGQVFAKGDSRYQIVGVVRDAPYRSLREPILPVAYVPFHSVGKKGAPAPLRAATLVVRTASANPMALASTLRREVPRARPEFRVSNIITEEELVRAQTIRERLLAMLALFFAAVALLLAAIGLYGVLDYSVLQQRREIGIRLAIGAPAGRIARAVAGNILLTVLAGAAAGFALSMASARYVEALLYQVKPDDPAMLLLPSSAILAAALLAALPAVLRAVSIDPAATLRAD